MPSEVGGVGAEGSLGREGERAAVEVGEFEVGAAGEGGFRDVGLGYLDAQVVVDGIAPGSRPVHRASEPPGLKLRLMSPCPRAHMSPRDLWSR